MGVYKTCYTLLGRAGPFLSQKHDCECIKYNLNVRHISQFAPPQVGVLAKCVSEGFEQVHFSKFQAFLQRGCTSFNPFLCNLGNSPHLIVPKDPFLLDAFTVQYVL